MAPKKEMAPTGRNPIDAKYHLSIQSKAVLKFTEITGYLHQLSFEILFIPGMEAVISWK